MSASSGDLVRTTINLTPRAAAAMDAIRERTGDGKTDVINNALRAYDLLLKLADDSGCLMLRQPDGSAERVWLP